MSKDKTKVIAAQGAAITPPAEQPTPPAEQPTPPAEQPTPPAEQPTPEKKADDVASDVLTVLDALGADGTEPNEPTVDTLEADETEVEIDVWAFAQATATEIFEQYKDRNEVFVTIDAQGFWNEDLAAAQNTKYRRFERS